MDITNCEVYYSSDLKDYGYTEDGTKFIGEMFFVEVENKRGDRWRLNRTFDGVKVEQWEEGPVYMDSRPAARAQCERIVAAIQRAGRINLVHWHRGRAAYGSDAYFEYGAAEELALERAGEFT